MNSPIFLRVALVSLCAALVKDAVQAAELPETPPDYVWAQQAGSAGADKTRGLATDAAGNLYMTGEFSKTGTFGEFTVESKGELDFFVAKYSPAGKCLWVRTGGGSKIDRGYGVAVDLQGNVFVTGHCQSTDAMFDGIAFENRGGDYDLFVAKYDATGKIQWLKSGGGAGYDYGHSIGVDQAGNCYVTGSMVGDCEFLGVSTKNSKSGHMFLAKLSTAGELAWLRVAGGAGGSAGEHLAVDAEGNAVVVGGASGVETFGDLSMTNKGREVYAVKYDASGQALWTFAGEGSTSASFTSVALDGHGGVCVCGMFKDTLALGGQKFQTSGKEPAGGKEYDLMVAKLDRDGKFRWVHTGNGKGVNYALCVAADGAGNCYVTGEFQYTVTLGETVMTAKGVRDIYAAKFDDGGALRWLRSTGGTKGNLGYCIVRDKAGALFLSGAFDGETAYGSTTLTSKGSNDIMLLKLGK
ncbi:MAG: SBBP repeat-containing protein [Chthoniobacter sp.]|uniref:SBBP repeat-containing protein n=1 Tax=Chthoniobacter sp. TaxID=2510640 RepID=UPI0032ADECD4